VRLLAKICSGDGHNKDDWESRLRKRLKNQYEEARVKIFTGLVVAPLSRISIAAGGDDGSHIKAYVHPYANKENNKRQ